MVREKGHTISWTISYGPEL